MDNILECKNLKKEYGDVLAVRDLSMDLKPGRIYAFLGPSGSGKTTTMKMIAGLTRLDKGSITVVGEEVGIKTKSLVAFMPTEAFYYDFLSVKGVGHYYRRFFSDFDEEKFEEYLEKLEIDRTKKLETLSMGTMAKLKLVATLARRARLYLLDEPFKEIDIIDREKVYDLVKSAVNDECAILISSHLIDEMDKLVDSAIYIRRGQIMKKVDKYELLEKEGHSLTDMYRIIYGNSRGGR